MHKIKLKNSDNMDVAREYPDYRFHITDSIIFTSDRKMLASLVVAGIPFAIMFLQIYLTALKTS